eukprot:jgi/Picsp_1/2817/NSC_01043-R1_ribonuclease p
MSVPRAIDAKKFADARILEILNVTDQIKTVEEDEFGIKSLAGSLRRRTRSHNRWSSRKKPNLKKLTLAEIEREKWCNRRMRRKKKFSSLQYCNPWENSVNEKNELPHRLPTHVWHAKRMLIQRHWDFMLPEGQHGKGRGTRAFARKLKDGYIVHDASYWCSIQLSGRIKLLLETLSWICGDVDTGIREMLSERTAPLFLQEFNFVAHRPKSPSEAYGPVACMFSPCVTVEGTQREENARLIFWVHCGYASELVADLRACLKQELLDSLVQLEIGSLGRIELRGPKTASVIAKVFETQSYSEALTLDLLDKNCVHCQSGKKGYGAVLSLSRKDEQAFSDVQTNCLENYIKPVETILKKILESVVNGHSSEKASSSFRGLEMVVYLIVHPNGMSLLLPREAYATIFKSITREGGYVTGQREWHWYHTISGLPFYPRDYLDSKYAHTSAKSLIAKPTQGDGHTLLPLQETLKKIFGVPGDFFVNRSPCKWIMGIETISRAITLAIEKKSLEWRPQRDLQAKDTEIVEILVWVRNGGSFHLGDIICNTRICEEEFNRAAMQEKFANGGNCIGVITSPKPHQLPIGCPSIALAKAYALTRLRSDQYKENRRDQTKIFAWSYSLRKRKCIPIILSLLKELKSG